MTFREFITEEIGLGDLGAKIAKVANSGGAFVSDQFDNEKPANVDMWLPDTNLAIPKDERTGRITHFFYKNNPIYIQLSDGTKASMTYDQYRRIKNKPAKDKMATIILQRHPNQKGYAKIEKCIVY